MIIRDHYAVSIQGSNLSPEIAGNCGNSRIGKRRLIRNLSRFVRFLQWVVATNRTLRNRSISGRREILTCGRPTYEKVSTRRTLNRTFDWPRLSRNCDTNRSTFVERNCSTVQRLRRFAQKSRLDRTITKRGGRPSPMHFPIFVLSDKPHIIR